MKGIILAGGSGTRLYPVTQIISKQMLSIYDKPMIYYPLSVLMLANIRDILIISTPDDTPKFKKMLGNGSRFGIKLSYKVQEEPKGLAQAFIIGEDFIGDDTVAMILGDNIFFGNGLQQKLSKAIINAKNGLGTVFGYHVLDPERFGVVEFDKNGKVVSIEEKPKIPKSNYAATGLYFYDNRVIEYAKSLKPSKRGELEITDINKIYLKNQELCVEILGRGYLWLDTGTFDSLNDASNFVRTAQKNGQIIACLEEIAYSNGWINKKELKEASLSMQKNSYGKYLLDLYEKNVEIDPARIFTKKEKDEIHRN